MTTDLDLHDDTPLGPPDGERLEWERRCREYIKRIFDAVLADRWDVAYGVYRESRVVGGEWFHVAVWAGLPNTVKGQLLEIESGTQRVG